MHPLKQLKGLIHKITGEQDSSLDSDASIASEESTGLKSGGSEFMSSVPVMLGTALLSAAIVIVLLRMTTVATPRVVTFDVVKYVNAERAVASKFFGQNDAAEVAPTLLDISNKTRKVIREVAGPKTLVVISQAIVQGQADDITNKVLKRLGLPTNVPTVNPTRYALDFAPTMIGHEPHLRLALRHAASSHSQNTAGLP